jgi:hypothetical protein
MSLPAPIRILDQAALQQILRQYTGSPRMAGAMYHMYSTSQQGYGYRQQPVEHYETYSRGKSTLLFKIIDHPNGRNVDLIEVLPKVRRSYGLTFIDLQLVLPYLTQDPVDAAVYRNYYGLGFTIKQRLSEQEVIQFAEHGMATYDTEYNRLLWR